MIKIKNRNGSDAEKITSLNIRHVTKHFPGIIANDDVSMDVGEHEIVALVGENGAGKTTLMNILMGLYRPDSGCILVNGMPVEFSSPDDAFAAGLGMVHQQYMLVHNMTVLENIALGCRNMWSFLHLNLPAVRKRIYDISGRYGLSVDPDAYVWQLSVGEQQRVELVKTLVLGARFLILDEPTSALTPQETEDLIGLISSMKQEIPVIFISHKLDEVKRLSDRIVILRHGKVVFTGRTADYNAADIAAKMTGHEIQFPRNTMQIVSDKTILDIQHLDVKSDRGYLAVKDLSLRIREGEIVGLAGVSGNGQRELCEALTGLRSSAGGKILFCGSDLVNQPVWHVIEQGMGYVPEDRDEEGIVPPFTVRENFLLKDSSSSRYAWHGFLNQKKITTDAGHLCQSFDVRCSDIYTAAGSLSGGNIQKIILAREISRQPLFLVAMYPIRGLDMGAAEYIHRLLLKERERGMGILLVSEELDELLDLSDRIAVIFKGQIQKILDRKDATYRNLGILMAGLREEKGAAK